MASTFDQREMVRTFDALVELNIVQYGESVAVPFVDEGFPFEIRVCHGWSKKPLTVHHAQHPEPETEKFGPGSDINKSHPDQVLGHINKTHIVALNIYPVFRPQFLLLTLDSFRSQDDPMELPDVAASWQFIHGVESPLYAMYNCTAHAGCSRHHKHIQVLPRPQSSNTNPTEFQFFPDRDSGSVQVPYSYFLHRFDVSHSNTTPTAVDVFQIYETLLGKCRRSLDIDEGDLAKPCPHNVILVKEWMILIPRRKGEYKGLMVNAAGMMGMPTVPRENLLQLWRDLGPAKALGEFGISNRAEI